MASTAFDLDGFFRKKIGASVRDLWWPQASRVVQLSRTSQQGTFDPEQITHLSHLEPETGAETRERPPKRAREDADAAPSPSGLQREKAQQDALAQVKIEKEALEDRLLCAICMEADAPRAVVFGPCDHFPACASCAAALQECPNCRATITTRTTIANSS